MQTVVYRGIDLALYMLVFDIVEGVKSDLKVKELLDRRYERLQSYGRFNDTKASAK